MSESMGRASNGPIDVTFNESLNESTKHRTQQRANRPISESRTASSNPRIYRRPGKSIRESVMRNRIKKGTTQSINVSSDQLIKPEIRQPSNHAIRAPALTSIKESINQSIDRSSHPSMNRSIRRPMGHIAIR